MKNNFLFLLLFISLEGRVEISESFGKGMNLFLGKIPFKNGGPPCISCHTLKGPGWYGGGTLAPDLTETFKNIGREGIISFLEGGSPLMADVYKKKPLLEDEKNYIISFLAGEEIEGKKLLSWIIPANSIIFFLIFLALSHLAWAKRTGSVHEEILKKFSQGGKRK